MYMGRKKIYITKEEQLLSRRQRQMKYYWKNSEKLKQSALKRYYARNKKI